MNLRRLFLPDKCVVCGDVTLLRYPLCRDCLPDFAALFTTPCPECGEERAFCRCFNGVKASIPFLFYYHGKSVKRIISVVKHRSNREVMRFFAQMLVASLGKTKFDCVTYPPRSIKNTKKYGYDQSMVIAEEMAKILEIPCVSLLYRKRSAPEQKLLSAAQRRKNIHNIFGVHENAAQYKRVLLFDDVITTGATVNECARMLRGSGVSTVKIICIAKTPKARRIGFKKTREGVKKYYF